MKYEPAEDLQKIADEISRMFFPHVQIEHVKCYRSYGTASRGTIARCHTIGKLVQKALGIKAIYVLEFLSERFDKLDEEEKIKTVIHELMHIPKSFGGGFKHHDFVCDKNINKCYKEYIRVKEEKKELKNEDKNWW
ncbi:MAG: putative metallopeptidase [Nanoarchaeota archaeon]|nr:putative metallopeptidase [Nanoarchaeota archaeon]